MEFPFEIECLGIRFARYRSADSETHVAAWRDECNSHVYAVTASRSPDGGWRAELARDGHSVGAVTAPGRCAAVAMALGAMRAHLLRTHRRTLRTQRREAAPRQSAAPAEMGSVGPQGFDAADAECLAGLEGGAACP